MAAPSLLAVFGRVLREQRESLGLTQEEFAHRADVDRSFVSQIERGVRQPALMTIWKLARALEVSPSTLLARVEKLLR